MITNLPPQGNHSSGNSPQSLSAPAAQAPARSPHIAPPLTPLAPPNMRPAPQPDDEPRRSSSSNKAFYIVALLGALGAAAWIGPSFVSASTAPDFTLYPSDGDPAITLSQYRGKVVVLDFWASWCPPCKAAIPAMERLHQANRGRGVKVMGINMSDNVDPEQFLKSMKVTYTNLANGDDVGKEYGVKGIPTLVVIGKDGSVALKHSGWAPQFEQQIQDAIDAELAK